MLLEKRSLKLQNSGPIANKEPDDDDTESETSESDPYEERRQMTEKVIKRIEKWSVIIFFLSFVIFMIIYWTDLLTVYNRNHEGSAFMHSNKT